MTRPVNRIETWTGGVKDHTIDDAVSVYCKEAITDSIGHFVFTVYTESGGSYYYDDIALNDIVKIFLGYDTPPANPNFIGKVGKISGLLSSGTGFVRIISGLSQGEILLRRFKKNKFYDGVGASTIVTEWANDLGIFGAGDIEADATAVTLEVATKSYFDLLQGVSDYWASAISQIKKDFLVDVDGHLHWKSRPWRTVGVETLTVGDNIISYVVDQLVDKVKNKIYVYGDNNATLPRNKDDYSDSLTNWTATEGNLSLNNALKKVGANSIQCLSTVEETEFKRTLPHTTIRFIKELNFWRYYTTVPITAVVRLLAPNTTNYFEAAMGTGAAWTFKTYGLGPLNEYDVDENPNGVWTKTNSPNWWNIEGIQFYCDYAAADEATLVDAIYWNNDRWYGLGNSPTSQTAYGQRDLEVIDEKLHSDTDCNKRGETLLYQLKTHPTQITVKTYGNTNILVGDRLTMTIPAEGISAVPFDVISVEHSHTSEEGFITTATMVNSVDIRQPVTADSAQLLTNLYRAVKALNISELNVG